MSAGLVVRSRGLIRPLVGFGLLVLGLCAGVTTASAVSTRPSIALFASDNIRSGHTVQLQTTAATNITFDFGQGPQIVSLKSMTVTMRADSVYSHDYQPFTILTCVAKLGPVTTLGWAVDSALVVLSGPGKGAISSTYGTLCEDMQVMVIPAGAPSFEGRVFSSGRLETPTKALLYEDGDSFALTTLPENVPAASSAVMLSLAAALLFVGMLAARRRARTA